MSSLSFGQLVHSSWHGMHGLKRLIWMHVLSAVIIVLFVLFALHFSVGSKEAIALNTSSYMPMYLVVLLLFVPFMCFAIKTAIERKAKHVYLFGYAYAAIASMQTAFLLGICLVLVFYGLFCLKVWVMTWALSTALKHGLLVVYYGIQMVLWVLGSLTVAVSLGRPHGCVDALKKTLCFCRRHLGVFVLLAFFLSLVLSIMGVMGYCLMSYGGALGGLISLLLHLMIDVFLVPYVIVMIAQLESQVSLGR